MTIDNTLYGLYGHNLMQHNDRTTLTNTLLFLPMLAITHLISACDANSDSATLNNRSSKATPDNSLSSAITTGTVAVSPEALFDFLYVATHFEFWNCVSSDNAENTYIALDSKDDETDEGFNPLLLMGLLREPQFADDPRALNEDDRKNDVKLKSIPVSFAVTAADSISVTLHSGNDFTSSVSVEDTVVYLTDVRTGPGRAFTAEDQLNHTHLTCTANNVGTNIMF